MTTAYCKHGRGGDVLAVLTCGMCRSDAHVEGADAFAAYQEACNHARRLRDFPPRFVDADLANVDSPALVEWVRTLPPKVLDCPSLLIAGPTGTGKTYAAYAVLRAMGIDRWQAVTYADLAAELRPSGRDPEAAFDRYAKTLLLFLDDLGAAKGSEWVEEMTYRLINRRYEQRLPSIFTTNVPLARLREVLGERVSSRLVEMCTRIVLTGGDRRRSVA